MALTTEETLKDLEEWFGHQAERQIGFPAGYFDYTPLNSFNRFLLNNAGDPRVEGPYRLNTKQFEREVIERVAGMLGAKDEEFWGYVATGSTEGTECAMLAARRKYPDGIVYLSDKSHFANRNVLDRLEMDYIEIRTDANGEMDYEDLERQAEMHRIRPAIVIANVGTGFEAAVDDTDHIADALLDSGVRRTFIHVDGAELGLALLSLPENERPGLRWESIDSFVTSGHKFAGTRPCSVFIIGDEHVQQGVTTYTGCPDTPISNSRDGYASLQLWYFLRNMEGGKLRGRYDLARQKAERLNDDLIQLGVASSLNDYGMTVTFPKDAIPQAFIDAWGIPTDAYEAHIICAAGVPWDRYGVFLDALKQTLPEPPKAQSFGPGEIGILGQVALRWSNNHKKVEGKSA